MFEPVDGDVVSGGLLLLFAFLEFCLIELPQPFEVILVLPAAPVLWKGDSSLKF